MNSGHTLSVAIRDEQQGLLAAVGGVACTFAYFLMSISLLPPGTSTVTERTASRASSCSTAYPSEFLTMGAHAL